MSSLRTQAALLVWGEVCSPSNPDPNSPPTTIAERLAALNNWWTNEHLPERLSLPGFLHARRYENVTLDFCDYRYAQKRQYLTVYEVENLQALTSEAYMNKLNNPTAGTRAHLPTLSTLNRAACRKLNSMSRMDTRGVKNVVGSNSLMLETLLPARLVETLSNMVRWEAINWFREALRNDQALLSYHLFLEDAETTAKGSASQSYRGIQLGEGDSAASDGSVKLILLIEGTRSLEKHQGVFDVMFWDAGYKEQGSRAQEYRLMCSMSSLYS